MSSKGVDPLAKLKDMTYKDSKAKQIFCRICNREYWQLREVDGYWLGSVYATFRRHWKLEHPSELSKLLKAKGK